MARHISFWIDDKVVELLEQLAETGVYGEGVDDVCEALILEGVRGALKAKFIWVKLAPPVVKSMPPDRSDPEAPAPAHVATPDDEIPF